MKRIVLGLVLAIGSSQAVGSLTEVDIEIDPVITHHYYYDDIYKTGDVTDYIKIDLPDVTLDPADIFRVNITFKDGKLLKVVNGAEAVSIESEYVVEPTGTAGFPKTNDGTVVLNIHRFQNVLNTTQSDTLGCYYWQPEGGYSFMGDFGFERSKGEIIDGSLFGDFTLEFTTPTIVDGLPFSTKTYTNNNLLIAAFLSDLQDDVTILVVIPEPGTVFLLGLGGLALLRKRGGRLDSRGW